MTGQSDTVLDVEALDVRYGPVRAVRGISFGVARGGITALLGANGAGKSSTLMAIAGVVPVASGRVSLFGKPTAKTTPDAIVRSGVGICPEGRRIFASLSVEENLIVAGTAVATPQVAATRREEMMERFPILGERRRQLAGLLSGGEQQMLAVARALMGAPKLLLMDEPSLGLAPQMVDTIFSIIEELQREGISILLVEQNAALALEVANHAVVMANGEIAGQGAPADLAGDTLLKSAYLAA
ncbi:ABC transporter ATP-binding protein [Marivita hallyeonensis]|uniref:Amino acid/amide ABC transporter ATP-binding protein 2, HAAT family n=1 Tax=Marivita hallyeonensis TaxID=996342 RepID=A0A1M5X284_9RHOB|nr:ABC transporter ATP-binding protein [Marivita hallyeonensis]SHH93929.1 amino acid/amide ABC transporter ATP-binding protein 2, HAAT family [Marivita hallyeonensis]